MTNRESIMSIAHKIRSTCMNSVTISVPYPSKYVQYEYLYAQIDRPPTCMGTAHFPPKTNLNIYTFARPNNLSVDTTTRQ